MHDTTDRKTFRATAGNDKAAPEDAVRVDALVSEPIWARAKHGKVEHAWNKVVDYGTCHLVAACRPDLKCVTGVTGAPTKCKECLAILGH